MAEEPDFDAAECGWMEINNWGEPSNAEEVRRAIRVLAEVHHKHGIDLMTAGTPQRIFIVRLSCMDPDDVNDCLDHGLACELKHRETEGSA